MPRGPRLDAPGAVHHVMIRGLDRQVIFRTEKDREDFLQRLATVTQRTGLRIFAWALLPNHVHLLVGTGSQPLAAAMRSLLTGYAGAFNRRHRRLGHLFQNRYKSILVEAEPYLAELVRYLHLNPLRAGLVKNLAALEGFPWCGHGALLGRIARPWQTVAEVLAQFGPTVRVARRRYREFVAAGATQGRRPDLQGGGLIRSMGGWEQVAALRRGREAWAADERILGSSDFVEQMQREAAARTGPPPRARALAALGTLVVRCARILALTPAELVSGGRRRPVAQARALVSRIAVRELGLPITVVAQHLGVSPTAVRAGVGRGDGWLTSRGVQPGQLLLRQWK